MLDNLPNNGIKQRKVNDKTVSLYARAMEKGDWKLNGEPIIISSKNTLINGQHRMSAVIKSGMTVSFLIVRGVDEQAMPTIDGVRPRTAKDILSIYGYANASVLGTAAKCILIYRNFGDFQNGGSRAFSNTEILELVKRHPELCHSTSYIHSKNINIASRGALAAIHYLTNQISPDDANIFFAKLISGIGLDKDDPVRLLRERLIQIKMSKVSDKRDISYTLNDTSAMIIKGWNAFRTNTTLKRISFGKKENFPKIV